MMKFIKDIKQELEEERKENELEWLIKNSLEIGYKGNGYITDKSRIYQILNITGKVDLIRVRKILFWKRVRKIEIRK
jgi:hypothetical protein